MEIINPKNQRPYVALAFLFVIFFITLYPTITSLTQSWAILDGNQSHGYIVLLLSLHLQYKVITNIAPNSYPIHNWIMPATTLLLCSLIWYVATITNIEIIQQLLLLPMLLLIYHSVLGFKAVKLLAPSVGLLIFNIPLLDYLTPSLIKLASYIVTQWMELTSIPALIEGNSFYLPSGQVEIAGGCSGVKYLTIALVLSIYMILTTPFSKKRQAALLITAIALSLLINWIRIFILIIIAHYSEMQSSLVEDHESLGWILFSLVIIPLILLNSDRRVTTINHATLKHNTTISTGSDHKAKTRQYVKYISIVIAIIIGPLLVFISPPKITPELQALNWTEIGATSKPTPHSMLTLKNVASNYNYWINTNNNDFYLSILNNWRSDHSKKLIPYLKNIYSQQLWALKNQERILLNKDINATALIVEQKRYGKRQLLLYWFKVGEFSTGNYSTAKLLQIPATILQQNLFTLTVINAECSDTDCHKTKMDSIQLGEKILALTPSPIYH